MTVLLNTGLLQAARALVQMRSTPQEQLAAGCVGVSGRPFRVCIWVYIRSTLRPFDKKLARARQNGPLIPCERRLAKMEISEIQEATF